MSAGKDCFTLAVIVVAMVSGAPARGQSAPCVTNATGATYYGIEPGGESVPFSGTLKVTSEQKLPDGNVIHGVTLLRQARDSSRRTMIETARGCVPDSGGQMHEWVFVSVNDPVARTANNWETGRDDQPKIAHVIHLTDPAPRQTKLPDPPPEELEQQKKAMQAAEAQAMQAAEAQTLRLRKEVFTEDLGNREINGVSARGTRSTRTIPAGEEGNEQTLVVMSEVWRSRELGLTLMAISDDPRRGRTTTEYVEFNRGEPDPAFFAPPAGYKVE
jgi:hypothetical protein